MRRSFRPSFISLLLLLCLALTGCGIAQEEVTQDQSLIDSQIYQRETVYIGAALPGDTSAAFGVQSAWETAADLIDLAYDLEWDFVRNEGIGTYGNAPVELVLSPSFRTPADAARAGEALADMGVSALVGAYDESFTAAIANRIEEAEQVMVAGSPSDPLLTDGETYSFGSGFFRIAPTPEMEMDLFFDQLKELNQTQTALINTIAVAYEDNAAGRQLLAAINEKARQNGMEVVARIAYTPGLATVAPEVQKMIANAPDVIIQASNDADLQMFLSAYAASRYQPELLFCYGDAFQSTAVKRLTLELELDYVAGILYTPLLRSNALVTQESAGVTTTADGTVETAETVTPVEYNEIFAEVNQLFRMRTGRDMTNDELMEFASVMVIAQAIGINATADKAAMEATLHGTPLDAPYLESGTIIFDENGQNTVNPGFMVIIRDGLYAKM